jgi:hypothetical protein
LVDCSNPAETRQPTATAQPLAAASFLKITELAENTDAT